MQGARGSASVPGVRPLSVVGAAVSDSKLLQGVLLDTLYPPLAPLPRQGLQTGQPLLVALYDKSLEATRPEGLDANLSINAHTDGDDESDDDESGEANDRQREAQMLRAHGSSGHGSSAVHGEAEALLCRFADGVAGAGVHVLCCQQRIAPALMRLLLERGVLPLPRLSLRHIGAVRRLTGATPLSLLEPPKPADLGCVGAIRRPSIGNKMYTHLLPYTGQMPAYSKLPTPVVTLVLCTPNRAAADELASAVSCALGTIGAATGQRRPRLLPGAGCIELLMAAQLRQDAALPTAETASDGFATGTATIAPVSTTAGAEEYGDLAQENGASASTPSKCDDTMLTHLRRETCALLAEALEDAVCSLAGGGLAGREAIHELAHVNLAEDLRVSTGGSHERSYFGWDAEANQPFEVLRLSIGGRSRDDDSTDSSSGDEDDDAARRRNADKGAQVQWAGIVELESEKLEAIASAVEVVCSVLSVACA